MALEVVSLSVLSRSSGKGRDSESGLDYFGARYYGSSMGRFMSPDLLGGTLSNPQSLNRYAYVMNNPLGAIDPTGLAPCTMADGTEGDDGNIQSSDSGVCPDGATAVPDLPAGGSTAGLSFNSSNDQAAQLAALVPSGTGGVDSTGSGSGDSDAFQPGSLAYAVFQGSSGTWSAANTMVNRAAIGATFVYGGALAAPAIGSGVAAGASYTANASGLLERVS
jgi:RHS repeat-associated protein